MRAGKPRVKTAATKKPKHLKTMAGNETAAEDLAIFAYLHGFREEKSATEDQCGEWLPDSTGPEIFQNALGSGLYGCFCCCKCRPAASSVHDHLRRLAVDAAQAAALIAILCNSDFEFHESHSMRFINPIPFVRDIQRSKEFYQQRLGLTIVEDFENFVLFQSGFAIHDGRSLEQTVWRKPSDGREPYGRRNVLLYFEDENIEAAYENIGPYVELIHPIEQQAWGQRVFRFYDPDGHAIEIGEPQSPASGNSRSS